MEKETKRWIIGLAITLIMYCAAQVYYVGQIVGQVEHNSNAISELQTKFNTGAAIYLTREQLMDILSGRDVQIKDLKEAATRIEGKLDKLLSK